MSEFAERVALITGGNAGIGRATAIEFAKQGAKVVVSGRREKEGNEVTAEIKALDGEAIFVKTDVSKESDVKAMIERTLATFGRLDFAFNNAGVEEALTPLPDQTEETYDQIMDINVKGVWLSLKHEIPAMLKTGGGAIVQQLFHCGTGRLCHGFGLCCQQTRCHRIDQSGRAGIRQTECSSQCRRTWNN
jgi:NAD(P)-dependent dehydrogenase (short-subunit alcohol dehydrogenase family)